MACIEAQASHRVPLDEKEYYICAMGAVAVQHPIANRAEKAKRDTRALEGRLTIASSAIFRSSHNGEPFQPRFHSLRVSVDFLRRALLQEPQRVVCVCVGL
jgi:hypothetical protein